MEDVILGEIQKAPNLKTIVRLSTFRGRSYVDVRDFFLPRGLIEYKPTRKGITIPFSKVSDVINILEKGEAIINREMT